MDIAIDSRNATDPQGPALWIRLAIKAPWPRQSSNTAPCCLIVFGQGAGVVTGIIDPSAGTLHLDERARTQRLSRPISFGSKWVIRQTIRWTRSQSIRAAIGSIDMRETLADCEPASHVNVSVLPE